MAPLTLEFDVDPAYQSIVREEAARLQLQTVQRGTVIVVTVDTPDQAYVLGLATGMRLVEARAK